MNLLPNVALVALTLNRKYIFKSHTSVLLQNLPGIQQVWNLAYACSCSAFWSLKSCGLKAWDCGSVKDMYVGFSLIYIFSLNKCRLWCSQGLLAKGIES